MEQPFFTCAMCKQRGNMFTFQSANLALLFWQATKKQAERVEAVAMKFLGPAYLVGLIGPLAPLGRSAKPSPGTASGRDQHAQGGEGDRLRIMCSVGSLSRCVVGSLFSVSLGDGHQNFMGNDIPFCIIS